MENTEGIMGLGEGIMLILNYSHYLSRQLHNDFGVQGPVLDLREIFGHLQAHT